MNPYPLKFIFIVEWEDLDYLVDNRNVENAHTVKGVCLFLLDDLSCINDSSYRSSLRRQQEHVSYSRHSLDSFC